MEQRNLILAIALSLAILITFQILFAGPNEQNNDAPVSLASEEQVGIPIT